MAVGVLLAEVESPAMKRVGMAGVARTGAEEVWPKADPTKKRLSITARERHFHMLGLQKITRDDIKAKRVSPRAR
jgi:hypothetical protein